MATEADHIALANRNHEALLYLLDRPSDFPEWIATVSFYKAIHVVEAFFRAKSLGNCHDHNTRLERLKRQYSNLFPPFNVLYQKSMIARYLYDKESNHGYSRFSDHMSVHDVVHNLVGKRLMQIEQICLADFSELSKNDLKQLHHSTINSISC